MSFFSWFRFQTLSHRKSRGRTTRVKRTPRTPLIVEQLEDRTVPSSVTVLASHLHTAGGLPELVRVPETGTQVNGNDVTFEAAPGVYHLTGGDGVYTGTYGTFTVASDGAISGTSGALTALGGTIDFNLSKLAAVTIFGTDLTTAAGSQQQVFVPNIVSLNTLPTDTVYLPAGTFAVTPGEGDGIYGTFTVAADTSGSLAITGPTSGAAVATGNTIHFDLTKLAAVTIFGTDLKTAAGLQQQAFVHNVVSLNPAPTDTVYLPASTFPVMPGAGGGIYGTFTVAADASGALAVTGATSGAAVASGNTIHFDEARLAAVTVVGTDLKTPGGQQQRVFVQNVVGPTDTDTIYLPASTFPVSDFSGHVSGSFTVAANPSGALVVTGATGAAIATGNTIDFDPCSLNRVQITPNSGIGWYIDGVVANTVADIVAIPDGNYTMFFRDPSGNITSSTFSVSSSGLSATQLPQDAPLVTLELVPCHLPVLIDVKVGNATDPINVASQGVLPVVLFGSADFDVTQVNLSTVRFAGAAVFQWSLADVNGDGRQDLVLKFRTQDTNLRALYNQLIADDINGDGVLDSNRQVAQVSLTGQTTAQQLFEGTDDVTLFLSGKALRDLLTSLAAAGLI